METDTEYFNRMDDEEARNEAIQDIAATFTNDIVSAISCVCLYENGVVIPDDKIEGILLNTHGSNFLNELAEFVLEKKGEQREP